jgi:hypothetical protein
MTQFGRGRYVDVITNRTIQSGGSIGGVKKAGVFAGSVSWPQGNMGSHVFYRAPNTQPTVLFSLFNTTLRPVQGTNYGVYSRRGIMG